jgi:HEAT repeat protein
MSNFTELIASLESTDAATRNRAAIRLMDCGDAAAIEPLIRAIERPENRSARGTLVYPLSEFDCSAASNLKCNTS